MMKYLIQSFTVFFLLISLSACAQNNSDRLIVGREHAQFQIKRALVDTTNHPFYDTLIKNKEVAIAVAEPILFSIYGKDHILKERPYACYLIDGFWYIAGTIPKGWVGGGFEIIINAKNAHVIKLTHYK